MPTTLPDDPHYLSLREEIQSLLAENKLHTRQAGEWEKVETYWHIGGALQSHFRGQPRAEYGQKVVRNLSKDIGLSETALWDILLFRRSLPILPTWGELGWSHIRVVIHLPTQDQRLFYLRTAAQGRWTVLQLRAAIRADAYGHHAEDPFAVPPDQDPDQGAPLRARFGELHTYRTVATRHPDAGAPSLDLGFGVACRADRLGLAGLGPDQLVTVPPAPDGRAIATLRPETTRRYTYPAWIERVVDGDTLIAIVDLGFDHETRPQRLRLRGIDCPELATQAGRNAKAYVQQVLSQVGFVVLTTHATDNYGRYLADLRYLPGQPDPDTVLKRGRYLNRELLDQRLARRYQR